MHVLDIECMHADDHDEGETLPVACALDFSVRSSSDWAVVFRGRLVCREVFCRAIGRKAIA